MKTYISSLSKESILTGLYKLKFQLNQFLERARDQAFELNFKTYYFLIKIRAQLMPQSNDITKMALY